jgi:hypothetical protein
MLGVKDVPRTLRAQRFSSLRRIDEDPDLQLKSAGQAPSIAPESAATGPDISPAGMSLVGRASPRSQNPCISNPVMQ